MPTDPAPDTQHPWPLFGLRIRLADLELRLGSDDDLVALAALAGDEDHPLHDPGTMPFLVPWTDNPGPLRARSTMQRHWRVRAEWQPDDWTLAMVAVRHGQVVGTQDIHAAAFAASREVDTGSYVGGAFQGRGIATAMRQAVLHLAFAGLGALSARSEAFSDNPASIAVSDRVGYRRDGTRAQARRGGRATEVRFLMTRDDWQSARAGWPAIEVEGLEACLELFGLAPAS